MMVGGTLQAVAVISDCLELGLWFEGLELGRQAAWRPGTIGMVSSSWLAAPCKQLLCLKVIARYLGSDCGLKLGRQAAWRPGSIWMVSSSWLAALCKQLLCFKVIARYLGSGYGFKLGRQAAWRPGCNRNGVVRAAPAVDQWMGVTWCTFGTVLCDEEPQRRTVGEIVFQRLDPFKIKGKVNSVGSFCRGTSFGRVTSASMSTAVTHRLDFRHVEADGARWHTPRGALLKSATRRRSSSATVPSTTCTPIPRSLICFRTTRSATVGTDTTRIRVGRRLL